MRKYKVIERCFRSLIVDLRSLIVFKMMVCLFFGFPVWAQVVTGVQGDTITIDRGKNHGVKVGMTGLIAKPMQTGSGSVDDRYAAFEVQRVDAKQCTASVVELREGETILAGHKAIFDERLIAPPAAPAVDIYTLVDRGTKLFNQGKYADAKKVFRQVRDVDPGNPEADAYLKLIVDKELEQARARDAAAEAERQRQTRISELRSQVESAIGAGDAEGAQRAVDELKSLGEGTGDYERRIAGMGPKTGDAKTWTLAGVSVRFRWIPAGSFQMGSPSSEADRDDDERQHRVTLSEGYWMAETETTQGLWQAVMGSNPSSFKGSNRPVEQVSWEDVQEFIGKLNRMGQGEFRLPTEAEWEYACRAGTTGAYAGSLDSMGWYSGNAGGATHDVGQKQPNAWGLYDMHGNVWEWCQDYWYGDYPAGAVTDPSGPSGGSNRVRRGGGWCYDALFCRSANRLRFRPFYRVNNLGFRLARSPE